MDKKAAQTAINNFKIHAQPTYSNSSYEATVGDIKKLIDEISKLTSSLVDAIDA